jgi:DNA adenine methylase
MVLNTMTQAIKYKIKDDNVSTSEDLFNHFNVGAKPFLKWAGGKGQLLDKFQEFYPKLLKQKEIKTFYEPFLGSGAVFFDIAQHYDIEDAYLYDINEELILTYKVIQKDVTKLLDFLYQYQKKYIKLDKKQRQVFFYDQRANFNLQRSNINFDKYSEQWFPRAAQLIFLNRTCYNGLYRVNSKGEFNSPAGDYDNPTICDEQNLLAVHQVLKIAVIKKADFKEIINDIKAKSFVYFDPPYRPISKTASFKAYSKQDFAENEQIQLAKLFRQLDNKGTHLMLSNSDPKNYDPSDNFFDDIYRGYNITRIPAKRMINSDPTKRGAINELVVTNYQIA